jgi:hypothetical protein
MRGSGNVIPWLLRRGSRLKLRAVPLQGVAALDHPQNDGGEKAERHDRHDGGHRGCKFHRKLLSDWRGTPCALKPRRPLVDRQDVSFLHCTIPFARQCEPINAPARDLVHGPGDDFLGAAKQLQTVPGRMVKVGIAGLLRSWRPAETISKGGTVWPLPQSGRGSRLVPGEKARSGRGPAPGMFAAF